MAVSRARRDSRLRTRKPLKFAAGIPARAGFDCELTAAVSEAVNIPVIASGGAGTVAHFADVFGRGKADAALAASIFHFGVSSARSLKEELVAAGVPVRLPC